MKTTGAVSALGLICESAVSSYELVSSLDRDLRLILVEIFFGNIVFRHLAGANFFVAIVGSFYAANDARFEGVSFIDQFTNAFRIDEFGDGQTLRIAVRGERLR